MVKQVPVSFRNDKGLLLRGFVHIPKQYDTAIVLLHGFPGHMAGTALRLSRILSARNYLCLRFDFSGTDTSEGKFADKLMSQEVKDTKAAIDFIAKHYPTKKLVLFGHSTGAIDAALYAHTDKRLSGVILSGAIDDLRNAAHIDFTDEQVRDFWTKGYIYKCPQKPRKKKHLWLWRANRGKLKKAFYDEFFTLGIPKAMQKYKRPLLVLHGEKDSAISLAYPKRLFASAHKPKRFVVIKGADHGYGTPLHTKQAADAIERFIRSV